MHEKIHDGNWIACASKQKFVRKVAYWSSQYEFLNTHLGANMKTALAGCTYDMIFSSSNIKY